MSATSWLQALASSRRSLPTASTSADAASWLILRSAWRNSACTKLTLSLSHFTGLALDDHAHRLAGGVEQRLALDAAVVDQHEGHAVRCRGERTP